MTRSARNIRIALGLTTLALAFVANAQAQANFQTLLVGIDHRTVTSLDGDWHYLVDPSPARALYGANGAINDKSYAQNTHPNISSGPHNDEYDFATAPTLHVPGDWNTQVPELFSYEGVVWYQRQTQNTQPQPGTRTFLHIGAANYHSPMSGSTRSVFAITRADSRRSIAKSPGPLTQAPTSSSSQLTQPDLSMAFPPSATTGTTTGASPRDVSLVTVPTTFIDDYDVHLAHSAKFKPGNNRAYRYVHVLSGTGDKPRQPGPPLRSTSLKPAQTPPLPRTPRAAPPSVCQGRVAHPLVPRIPKLYKVTLAAGDDRITDDIGFRDIRVDGTRILLNGKPVFLRGVNVHAVAPVRGGRADNDQ